MSLPFRFSKISRIICRSFSGTCNECPKTKSCPHSRRRNPPICKKKSPYVICQPKVKEFPNVLKIMEKNYYREEPTLKFLGLAMNETLSTRIMDRLTEGNSLVAKCRYTGRMLGVSLNETVKPWDSLLLARLAERQKCPKTKKLLMFYSYLEGAPRLFDQHRCLFEIFSTTNVFIDKGERKYGLGIMLTKASVNLAIDRGYKLLRCDATNFAFSQLLEKLKFKLEKHIPYESYVDKNGEKVFKNVQVPNIGVKIYTLNIQNRQKFVIE